MARERILVVEDEEEILELVRYNLERQGYRVVCAASGEEGLRQARAQTPDLVVLDLMLPGVDGLEVCRRLKRDAATQAVPIVMLTAKTDEPDVVAGLETGADDYVAKPFSPRVLVARIRAVLRRKDAAAPEEEGVVRIRELVIDPGRHAVTHRGAPIELTATEFRVLWLLARRPGRVHSRCRIASEVHGGESIVTDRSVDVQIVALRKKLGAAGRDIETVRGVGYRFKE